MVSDLTDENSELYKGKELFTKRKVNPEAKKCIETIIESINTKDLEPDTAVKALSTLKCLYLIDVEIMEDKKGHVRVKRWFEIKE